MPTETILIVDDKESIRKSLKDILLDEGYEVAPRGWGAMRLGLIAEVKSVGHVDARNPAQSL